MTPAAPRLALIYSSVGHFFFHYLAAMYFTIVVSLAEAWQQPFHELIRLWTPAFVLIGLAALPAGRLADRWSAAGMLVVMFLGMGGFTIACGLVEGPGILPWLLAGIGLFAAIYHPVGIAWLVRHAGGGAGRRLAVNGIFGGLGAAAAAGGSGLLIETLGWRWAFAVPGLICLLAGVLMAWHWRAGRLGDAGGAGARPAADSGSVLLYPFALMLLPMFAIGLIYNATQAAMPKLFEERLGALVGGGLVGVGALVTAVYTLGALMQLAGGWLADRFELRRVYLGCWAVQVPLLAVMAGSGNQMLLLATALLVIANTAALPAENLLLAHYTPTGHHGLAFGVKFVLAFGAGPIGVELIALSRRLTQAFDPLVYGLSLAALAACVAVALLPRQRAAA